MPLNIVFLSKQLVSTKTPLLKHDYRREGIRYFSGTNFRKPHYTYALVTQKITWKNCLGIIVFEIPISVTYKKVCGINFATSSDWSVSTIPYLSVLSRSSSVSIEFDYLVRGSGLAFSFLLEVHRCNHRFLFSSSSCSTSASSPSPPSLCSHLCF